MTIPKVTEMETLCSKLAGRVTEEWDRHLIGGSWPVDPSTLEDLARLSKGLERSVETGVTHRVQKPVWRSYRWRRVYDGEGKIGYELIKKASEPAVR